VHRLDDRKVGLDSRWGENNFLFSLRPYRVRGPSSVTYNENARSVSPGVKRQGRESHESPPSSAEFKNGGAVPPLSRTSSYNISMDYITEKTGEINININFIAFNKGRGI
jgi:hypothetical protein